MFSVSRKTVYNVLNRSEKEGRLKPKSGGGRKTKISKRVDRLIMRIVIANPESWSEHILRISGKNVT